MSIFLNHPLAALTSLGAQTCAERLVPIRCEYDLKMALRLAAVLGGDFHLLGGGSNVIPAQRVAGITALMCLRGRTIHRRAAESELIVAAGESWHETVRYSLGQGLQGLECLALIPGSVGAAPVQNIGAYGSELSDVLTWVEAYDRETGQVERLTRQDCEFSYRDSVFRREGGDRWIILRVALRLFPFSDPPTPQVRYPDLELELDRLGWSQPSPAQVAEAVIRVRRRKLPSWREVGNVGSVFKNPVVSASQLDGLKLRWPTLKAFAVGQGFRLAAAQLIDLAGLKSASVGAAKPWHRQPLVLTLQGRGHSDVSDFVQLLQGVRRSVADRFGVALEVEPRFLGGAEPPL